MIPRISTPVWDDLRAPASAINPAGSAAAATIDTDDGTLLFANGSVQTIAVWFQMPHAWKEGSDISPHLHYMKTTSAAGTVKFQMKYKWTNIGETELAFSAFTDGTVIVSDANTAGRHAVMEFADISGVGKKISSMLCMVIQRFSNGTGADTYGSTAKLMEVDVHYLVDSFGSIQEYVK